MPAAQRHELNRELARIKADPGWLPGRYPAGAQSTHHGSIVDLNFPEHVITYRVQGGGHAVEVEDIVPVSRIFTG